MEIRYKRGNKTFIINSKFVDIPVVLETLREYTEFIIEEYGVDIPLKEEVKIYHNGEEWRDLNGLTYFDHIEFIKKLDALQNDLEKDIYTCKVICKMTDEEIIEELKNDYPIDAIKEVLEYERI